MRPLRAVFIAAAGLVLRSLAAGAEGPALAELIDRFDHLRVGEAVAVSDLRLSAGHFECTLKSGRAAPVRAGEEVVGLFFEGEGGMEYVSVDPVEEPLVLFDTKKGSSLKAQKTEKGVVLRDTFQRLLWLAQASPLPELAGPPAAPLAGAFGKEREKFARMHTAPLSHDFALQRLNAPSAPLVWAEMEGGKEDLVYELDHVDHPSEALILLHPSESRDPELRKFLWPVALSHQPIGRDARDPSPPRFLLTAVDVDLAATDGNDVRMKVVETVVPVGAPLSALRFDLDNVWYAQTGANLGTRAERVSRVTDDAGHALAFDHRNDEIIVQLAAPTAADKPVRLHFEIDGDFLVRPGGDNYWELGVAAWFPEPYLGEQAYTFHAVVRVPKPFVPFASGTRVRRESDGEDNVLETRIDEPVQYAVVLAGKYVMQEDVRDGVTIRVATYDLENETATKQLIKNAAEVLAFYKTFLGPFPFDEFDIIEINDVGFGQAPPGVMFITTEAFDPLVGDMTQLSARGIARTFAHEIAHQYWGIAVRIPAYTEQWLSESFAEYCAALFLKQRRSEAVYKSLVGQWKRTAGFADDAAPIPMASRVYVKDNAIRRGEIRRGLLYGKGPLLLAALNRELGDEAFLSFLRAYQEAHRWKFGSTKSVAAQLQATAKRDFMPFFDQYYWGTAMPKD